MHHDTQLFTVSSRQARSTTSPFAPCTFRPPCRVAAVLVKVGVVMIVVVACLAGGAVLTDAAESHDISIEMPAIELKGDVLEPELLGEPWIPKTVLPSPIQVEVTDDMLDAQRNLVVKAKGVARKRAQQIRLAAMLYMKTHEHFWDVWKVLEDPQGAQLKEAIRILEDVVQHAGDNLLDEDVRRLLAACQFLLKDYPASEKSWRVLLEENPNSKYRSYHRAWLAYALLKQSKDQDALDAVAAETIDGNQFELAYVEAWAKWRMHDGAGALKAIAMAQKNWQDFPCNRLEGICLEVVKNRKIDYLVVVLAGRADVPLSQVLAEFKWTTKNESTYYTRNDYIQLQDLGVSGYGRVGRWADGIAALGKAVEIVRDHVLPSDRVAIRAA